MIPHLLPPRNDKYAIIFPHPAHPANNMQMAYANESPISICNGSGAAPIYRANRCILSPHIAP